MNSYLALTLGLLLIDFVETNSDGWRMESSPDGRLVAMVRGEKNRAIKKNRTLAGTITSRMYEFHADQIEFTLCWTRLPRMARHFADDETLFASAKKNILNQYSAVADSFDDWNQVGGPARVLRYHVPDSSSVNNKSMYGAAVVIVRDDAVYAANAMCDVQVDEQQINTFINSIKMK